MKNLLNKLSSVSFVDRDKVTVIKFLQKSSLPSFFSYESELFWQTILPNIIFLPKYSHSIANLKV